MDGAVFGGSEMEKMLIRVFLAGVKESVGEGGRKEEGCRRFVGGRVERVRACAGD